MVPILLELPRRDAGRAGEQLRGQKILEPEPGERALLGIAQPAATGNRRGVSQQAVTTRRAAVRVGQDKE
jgi:hypothetical protein